MKKIIALLLSALLFIPLFPVSAKNDSFEYFNYQYQFSVDLPTSAGNNIFDFDPSNIIIKLDKGMFLKIYTTDLMEDVEKADPGISRDNVTISHTAFVNTYADKDYITDYIKDYLADHNGTYKITTIKEDTLDGEDAWYCVYSLYSGNKKAAGEGIIYITIKNGYAYFLNAEDNDGNIADNDVIQTAFKSFQIGLKERGTNFYYIIYFILVIFIFIWFILKRTNWKLRIRFVSTRNKEKNADTKKGKESEETNTQSIIEKTTIKTENKNKTEKKVPLNQSNTVVKKEAKKDNIELIQDEEFEHEIFVDLDSLTDAKDDIKKIQKLKKLDEYQEDDFIDQSSYQGIPVKQQEKVMDMAALNLLTEDEQKMYDLLINKHTINHSCQLLGITSSKGNYICKKIYKKLKVKNKTELLQKYGK